MRALLLFNPAAGSGALKRLRTVEAVANALRERRVETEIQATRGPGTAGSQASEATTDVVFACGGDGTVHEVLQGLVGAKAALGVIPLGSANALARDLGLPMDPVAAALRQLEYVAQVVPVGQIEWGSQRRYFLVMAGAGPHAALVYDMAAVSMMGKQRLGRMAYYLRSAALFARRSVPLVGGSFAGFAVEYVDSSGHAGSCEAVSAIAVRIGSLGGLFHPLTRGGSLRSDTLRLVLVRPPAVVGLPLWFGMSWLGLEGWNPLTKVVDVRRFACVPRRAADDPDVQADGEWLGRGRVEISMVPDALRLLMPATEPTEAWSYP